MLHAGNLKPILPRTTLWVAEAEGFLHRSDVARADGHPSFREIKTGGHHLLEGRTLKCAVFLHLFHLPTRHKIEHPRYQKDAEKQTQHDECHPI